MYSATMFSYGKHSYSVGISGICGCMGVIVQHGTMLYAIHIPDNPKRNRIGGDAFIKYVSQAEN
nr:hypothetical protein [Rhodopirellula sp. SM50]